MKINNTTQIRGEDFSEDDREVANRLGAILNPFMQQVVELSDKRIDFENRVENFLQVEFTLDSNGVPTLNNKINTGKSNIRGFQVIAIFGSNGSSILAESQPFINYTPLGNGIVEVKSITGGLPENTKILLNIVVY